MTKVFVGNAKYLLTDESGNTMTVGPNKFEQIPDAFTGDLTYKRAVHAGFITPYVSLKDGEKAEEAALTNPAKPGKANAAKAANGENKPKAK